MALRNMTDEKFIKDLGYDLDGEFCPENITKGYLKDMLQIAIDECPEEEKIGRMVVGVPELWLAPDESDKAYESIDTLKKLKSILHDIKNEMPEGSINEIETVSEPALACAYYAWKYRENKIKVGSNNPDFNGHMLIIDYGGGTLDINLCKVTQTGESCEISVLAQEGAGDNNLEDNDLGIAGYAYMNCVVKEMIGTSDVSLNKKYELFHQLEFDLQQRKAKELDPKFKSNISIESRKKLKDEPFIEDFFENKHLTYGILIDVFRRKISVSQYKKEKDSKDAVIDEKLNSIITTLETIRGKQVSPKDFDDNLKYVLTGGFCNFILTEMAIKNILGIPINDYGNSRIEGMDMGSDARRHAIAYGATLVAEGKVKIKRAYKYTLGIYNPETKDEWLAFKKGEELRYNEQKYVKRFDRSKPDIFIASEIPCIYYDPKGTGKPLRQPPKSKYKKLFELSEEDLTKYYRIGFSLDEDERITMYLQEMKEILNENHERKFETLGNPIPRMLDSIKELFDKIRDIGEYEEV